MCFILSSLYLEFCSILGGRVCEGNYDVNNWVVVIGIDDKYVSGFCF